MASNRKISTGLTESERLRELLWQSIQSPGLNPENTFLLLVTLLEREFPDEPKEDLETKSKAFRQLVESPHAKGGLGLAADRLQRILSDFKHPQEVPPRLDPKTAERMAWMRARVARLLPGEAMPRGGIRGHSSNTTMPASQATAPGVMRRLNRDRPDLAQAVAEGQMSANAAAIEAGFRRRKVSVPVDSPGSIARSLRKHMSPDQLGELVRLLLLEED